MTYKTILVHVDAGPGAPARIRLAIDQVRSAGAHLVGAADMNADLPVMGCYGHPRYRKLLLCGAAATVLRTMAWPDLLAH